MGEERREACRSQLSFHETPVHTRAIASVTANVNCPRMSAYQLVGSYNQTSVRGSFLPHIPIALPAFLTHLKSQDHRKDAFKLRCLLGIQPSP